MICLLLIILTIVVSLIIEVPLELLARIFGNPTLVVSMAHALSAIGQFISASLVGPLVTIALTLIYYDQRVRKEGFDLQLMMAALQPGQQQSIAAANTQ